MAYTSLYRQYRPDTFDKVIGQDHIVRTLINQINTDTVGHAYLFTGTRGTGKTSVAKIFARAVNCQHPVEGSPCGKCASCVELASPNNFDILEIDAASNNGVDQIREIIDKTEFQPTVGRYKVYIIDEVHMLTKSAFNALLKTLEEPPKHVIFILATTEVQQIPATILSRCLRFDFRLVPRAEIAKRIRFIFDDVNATYENEAVDLIASAGNGSVRDALSIADMCMSYCSAHITYNGVLEVLGASDPKRIASLASAIADGNVEETLSMTASLCELGKSVGVLAQNVAETFRGVLYVKTCASAKSILALPDEVYALYKAMADKYSVERCLMILRTMNSLQGEFRFSTQHRILFEAAVIRCAAGDGDSAAKIAELQERVTALERKVQSFKNFKSAPAKKDAGQVWGDVVSELDKKGYPLLALSATEAEVEETDEQFVVKVSSRATYGLLSDTSKPAGMPNAKSNRDVLNEVFAPLCSKTLVLKEVKKLSEDTALPFIKEMFGKYLEIK